MLETLLRKEIQEKGPLSQKSFMDMALRHPRYGYYRSQQPISHDFVTSPEICQAFGEIIGLWAIDCFHKLQQPDTISLIELGPGKGTMMADLLRAAAVSKSFEEALKIYCVEINPIFREAQYGAISRPASWVESFKDIPSQKNPVIIIANEFFDVMPVQYFVRKNNVVSQRSIALQEDQFAYTLNPLHENMGPDEAWEECPEAEELMHHICKRLLNETGVFLCIDYGYEEGRGDSLQALYQGAPSDPLAYIGLSDLTCHVNFGRLKEIALSQGLGVLGPLPQGKFLKNIGFDTRIEMLKQNNPSQKASLEAAATRLTHPQQMGSLFKVMAVFSPASILPLGFEL
jgi:NADH dehydrogenase [ubiquinone] 1 alpha subcomplex assembly factor 7